ncbi:hypothetical protein [Bacteroides xylanisolvens]|uniref:hypothetical protein n=1 Tax=Bacteroides xylanisolvens TaxID=371601 RepID=UPI00319DF026
MIEDFMGDVAVSFLFSGTHLYLQLLTVHYKFNLQKSKYKSTGVGLSEQQRL